MSRNYYPCPTAPGFRAPKVLRTRGWTARCGTVCASLNRVDGHVHRMICWLQRKSYASVLIASSKTGCPARKTEKLFMSPGARAQRLTRWTCPRQWLSSTLSLILIEAIPDSAFRPRRKAMGVSRGTAGVFAAYPLITLRPCMVTCRIRVPRSMGTANYWSADGRSCCRSKNRLIGVWQRRSSPARCCIFPMRATRLRSPLDVLQRA